MSEIQVQTDAREKASDKSFYSKPKKSSSDSSALALTGKKGSDELFYYKKSSSHAGPLAGSSAGSHGWY